MPLRGRGNRPNVRSALILAVLLVVASGSVRPGARGQALDPFRVDEVKVDATAESATMAREQAHAAGQSLALARLLKRMTLRRDRARLPRPGAKQITDLVSGLGVVSERTSDVRYIGELTVHFKPEQVRALLRDAKIDFVDTPSRPVLVLPVFDGPLGPVLWDEPNPWRGAWARLSPRGGLVPFVQALGDLSDFQLIDAVQVIDEEAPALTQIAERYGAASVLVVIARTRPAGGASIVVEIEVSRFDVSQQTTQPVGAFRGAVGEDEDQVFEATVAAVAAEIEERWKLNNVVLSGPESRLIVRVPISDLRHYLAVRQRLGTVLLLRGERLLRLSRRQADIELTYLGDIGRLTRALAQSDMALSRESPGFTATMSLLGLGVAVRPPDWTLRLEGPVVDTPEAAPTATDEQ